MLIDLFFPVVFLRYCIYNGLLRLTGLFDVRLNGASQPIPIFLQ